MGQSGSSERNNKQQQQQQQIPTKPVEPPPLPRLLDCANNDAGRQHLIQNEDDIRFLHSNLPLSLQDHEVWHLLYSSSRDGLTIQTFYKKVASRGPTLLLIRDDGGAVFGGFASVSWQKSTKFFGTSDSFVFTLRPERRVWKSTRINDHYMYLNFGNPSHSTIYNGLGMGGQIKFFSLEIAPDFDTGVSNEKCATFSNACLASKPQFRVAEIEVYGFPLDARTADQLKTFERMNNLIIDRAKTAVTPEDIAADMFILDSAGVHTTSIEYEEEQKKRQQLKEQQQQQRQQQRK